MADGGIQVIYLGEEDILFEGNFPLKVTYKNGE